MEFLVLSGAGRLDPGRSVSGDSVPDPISVRMAGWGKGEAQGPILCHWGGQRVRGGVWRHLGPEAGTLPYIPLCILYRALPRRTTGPRRPRDERTSPGPDAAVDGPRGVHPAPKSAVACASECGLGSRKWGFKQEARREDRPVSRSSCCLSWMCKLGQSI